jgi:NAD(P)-dependent dehydrogenase (short-subunit alcohol dehydrogenase family)
LKTRRTRKNPSKGFPFAPSRASTESAFIHTHDHSPRPRRLARHRPRVRAASAAKPGDRVIATARTSQGLQALEKLGAQTLQLDVADPASISNLALAARWREDRPRAVRRRRLQHRDATEPPTQQDFDRLMHTNVLGAMQVIPQVAPLVEAAKGRFVFITSGMAQIAGADSSFGWLYRVSKAALNMAVAAARHDYPAATLVAMSPGWVQTDMGGPGAPLTGAAERRLDAQGHRRHHAAPERRLPRPRRHAVQGLVARCS